MDLFPSRVSHQFSQYMSWKIDLFHQGRDDFQIFWANKFVHAFPPFALIGRALQNVNQDWCLMVIVTSAWLGQPWFQGLLTVSVKNPTTSSSTQRSAERSFRKAESTCNAQFTATGNLENLRKN